MLKALQKYLTITLIILGGLYLAYELFLYSRARLLLPPGTTVAGVDVGSLTAADAAATVRESYAEPLSVSYRDEVVDLHAADVGFTIDVDGMVAEAEAQRDQREWWRGFLAFLLNRSLNPVEVELRATHDRELLRERLQMITSFLDQPAKAPQLLTGAASFQYGESGFVADIEASLPEVEAALYRPDNRGISLVVVNQDAPPLSLDLLARNIEDQLDSFSGIGSVFVMDLETGEEISVNGDVAISGLSILKIPIFVETYRVLDGPPNEYVVGLLYETAVRSSNYSANLLLHVIAGVDNTYEGAERLTESMRNLGLDNTFMAIPYDANPVANRPSTYITSANTDPELNTRPDTAMQTTAEEVGTLLSMVYYCAQGKGALLAIYPDGLNPADCQAIIDLMIQNDEGNLIRFGVPESVAVSHKHGWDFVTQGDAGIVFSPGGDFVIVEYVTDPNSDWLSHEIGFPILREIARATYNYFNFEDPNLEDPMVRAEREAERREAAAAAAAAEAAAEATATAEAAPVDGEAITEEATPTP